MSDSFRLELSGLAGLETMVAQDDRPTRLRRQRKVSACVSSLLVHVAALIVFGLIFLGHEKRRSWTNLVASTTERSILPTRLRTTLLPHHVPMAHLWEAQVLPSHASRAPDFSLTHKLDDGVSAHATDGVELRKRLVATVVTSGGGLEGRQAAHRSELFNKGGGNAASEAAVARGLRWLMAHQLNDGSWRFDLRQSPQCAGLCRDHGTIGSSTASTGLALLPFLGAGFTHIEGEYQEVVRKGIYYLTSRMIETSQGGDLQEGTMYAQALATIALCEAHAMTEDKSLRPFAQLAIDFIVNAQHKQGGWRYLPGQPGDTTVTGWQVMALKSGRLGKLNIPPTTWYAANRFLDGVQTNDGVNYGYQRPEVGPTTSAIGLLCRMYLGWPRDHRPLARGVMYLSKQGPIDNDMYFNFYATQVLHHYGGAEWDRWNPKIRDLLIRTQETEGHEAGSWQFIEPHSKEAGRLYNTAMAIMILEVYYRYLPLYGEQAVTDSR